ncbi:hypothetical protein ALC53_09001 [Atta colombica]|uniref:Uncharacterized protein n=1 Tax=Atta colombica TaxID=520822 RepID=A0A195B877_9HYME|nr:hypothetical protein ALC53_09001 [Atta colombica]
MAIVGIDKCDRSTEIDSQNRDSRIGSLIQPQRIVEPLELSGMVLNQFSRAPVILDIKTL